MSSAAEQLRTRVQQWRKSLDPVHHQATSHALDLRLLSWFQTLPPQTLWATYRPLSWEWQLPRTHEWFARQGGRWAFPRIDGVDLRWHLADLSDPSGWESSSSYKSLLEPRPTLPEVDPAALQGVIVPGVAFSFKGERMGAGGGFYDRFLSRHPQILRVAVAAQQQVFSELPGQRPDEPRMHQLITDLS